VALKRLLMPAACLLLLLSVAALGYYGWRWLGVARYNAALIRGDLSAAGQGDRPHHAFALAYAFDREGRLQDALNLYHRLATSGPPGLAGAARYNLANGYLRQALALDGAETRDLMLPLAELAKTAYREHLRENSDDWAAKYNLERALQLLPDPREPEQAASQTPDRGAQSAVITEAEAGGLP
jgi:mxaK protein